jgi:hypothetical protein
VPALRQQRSGGRSEGHVQRGLAWPHYTEVIFASARQGFTAKPVLCATGQTHLIMFWQRSSAVSYALMIVVAIGFGAIAAIGLLAATRPGAFVRYFLAERQRQRLAGNMSVVSSVGWFIFGAGAWMGLRPAARGVVAKPVIAPWLETRPPMAAGGCKCPVQNGGYARPGKEF